MKTFVAGATGTVSLPPVRELCTLDRELTGMTRAGPGVDRLRQVGASASAVDAFDRQAGCDAIEGGKMLGAEIRVRVIANSAALPQ